MYRVLLVDDHVVVRKGVRSIMEDRYPTVVIDEACSGDEALAKLDDLYQLVLLDLSMPGRSGFDLLAQIRHRCPTVPVLILSLHSEEQFAVRALRAGAAGYMTKCAAPEQLIVAVDRIVKGGRYISEGLAERLATDPGARLAAPYERLSDREFSVLRGIASGEGTGEIAERMHLSIKTVSTYRARLLEKMGMGTNAELTRYALEHGLV